MSRADETQTLWLQYRKSGDQALRDRLILTYAPLVKYVAGRLGSGLPAHVDEGDLVSYGLLGLIGAGGNAKGWVVAVGALAIAGWLASLAVSALRRR